MLSVLRKPWVVLLATLAGCFGGGIVAGISTTIKYRNHPPVQEVKAQIVNSSVERGGILYLNILSRDNDTSDCLGSPVRELTREFVYDGKQVFDETGKPLTERVRIYSPQIIPHPNEENYVVDVHIPDYTPAGKWTLNSETQYDCGIVSGIKRSQLPQMQVTVIDAVRN